MATTSIKGNSFLSNFIDQCKKLSRTMTIKSGVSAKAVNDFLILKYGSNAVDQLNPSSWKYYRNISGEYHPTDEMMTVTSLDSLEVINFTKENLVINTATKENYAFGTRYYYALVDRYPDQEQLILGILYPVDKDKAITSNEGTILGYPAGLVEEQEMTLMHELEVFIKGYLHRWNVPAFAVTDSLYNTAYHAQLYLTILPKLINLRTKRCHTNEVHSFHVREYLASHNYLNKYLPYLTLKQSLYLYRNIRYLMRNAGSVKTFNELLQKILTDRRIPMSEYSIRQLNEFDESHYPEIITRRKPINNEVNTGEVSYIPIESFFNKEESLAYGNSSFYAANSDPTVKKFQNSPSSVIQTKTLESNMINYNDAVPDPLPEVMMRQWAYMASHDLYNVSVNFKDPRSSQIISLYAKDALVYHQYLLYKSIGINITTVPEYFNQKARRRVKPTVAEMVAICDKKFVDMPSIASDILIGQPELTECFSTHLFYTQTYQIYEEAQKHWMLLASESDMDRRGYLEGMILRLYQDELIKIDVGTTSITDWLSSVNLPEYDYTYEQAQELMTNIFIAATGLETDDTALLANIQKNLVEMFMRLSSYTIQTIREINDSAIKPLNWPAVRIGNIVTETVSDQWVEMNSRINDVRNNARTTGEVESAPTRITDMKQVSCCHHIEVPIASVVVMESSIVLEQDVSFKPIDISYSYPGFDPSVHLEDSYLGKEYFLALSDAQKQALKNNPPF